MIPRTLLTFVLTAFLTTSALPAAPITWNFSSGAGAGSYGNVLAYTSGGITLTVTSWGLTGAGSTFESASTGRWSGGLGACNQEEGGANCASNSHTVDNSGDDDFVLFQFSQPVDPASITLQGFETNDTDFTYWTGTTASSTALLAAQTLSGLGSLGFGSAVPNSGYGNRTATLVSGDVNALLVGASRTDTERKDYFKIYSLTANPGTPNPVPEPSTFGLLGASLVGLSLAIRRRKA